MNKKVLVTGGTQGIGASTVKLLIENGYKVYMTYRSSSTIADEMCKKYQGNLFAYKLDQGNPEAIVNAKFLNEHEWYAIVFNAALGSATVNKYANDNDILSSERDEAMIRVNALGPLWIYKAVKEKLLQKDTKTKLIFLSSVGGGITAFPKFSLSDGMSKSAVAFLAKQVAAENTHTLIDVFSLCPGATETPMFTASTLEYMTEQERKEFENSLSKKRLIEPKDIAYWILQLLADESTVLHGSNIDASMGLGIRPGIMTEQDLH